MKVTSRKKKISMYLQVTEITVDYFKVYKTTFQAYYQIVLLSNSFLVGIKDDDLKSYDYYFFKKLFIGVQFIYKVALVSAVQQSESVIHTYVFTLF